MSDPTKAQTRVAALREGGMVQRFHTMPTLGDASVAKHSWGVASLILELYDADGAEKGPPSPDLIRAALYHDTPAERFAGDIPGQIKWIDPILGERQANLEATFNKTLGIELPLNTREQLWLKACDQLVAYMFCSEQMAMGNRYAEQTARRILSWAQDNRSWIPVPVWEAFSWYWQHVDDVTWWPGIRDIIQEEDDAIAE